MTHPIILYDGVCGLCNRLNQFVLPCDPKGVFHFASLQSEFAARILMRHGLDPRDLNTLYVVVDHDPAKTEQPGEFLVSRSDAAIFVLKQLGGIWKPLGSLIQIIPKPFRNWGYNLIARNRYSIFGRFETCMLPGPEYRDRFLDV